MNICSCLVRSPQKGNIRLPDDALTVRSAATVKGDQLRIHPDGVEVTLTVTTDGVHIQTAADGVPEDELIPFLKVLNCSMSTENVFRLSALSFSATPPPGLHTLFNIIVDLEGDVSAEKVTAWANRVQRKAFQGIPENRRFLVLVNPHGGQGKALQMWEAIVSHVFDAAGIISELQLTGPSSSPTNAREISHRLNLSDYDALVPISGDGIINEILNGLATRPDAKAALKMPIAPIPGGSGNAISVNICGSDRMKDVAFAALNAVKGLPMPLDLCTVTQGTTKTFSFLSQAFGLAADLDIGTEWMRFMGDTRFTLGFLWGALMGRTYDIEITLKVVSGDKQTLVKEYNSQTASPRTHVEDRDILTADQSLPPLQFGTSTSVLPAARFHDTLGEVLGPGWHKLRCPVQVLYGGKLPWVSQGSMQFPLARDDGFIDLVLVPPRTFKESLAGLEGSDRGGILKVPGVHYYKVEAYRVVPLAKKGYISVDGESVAHETFQVESQRGLARVLSMKGRWTGLDNIELE